LELRGFEKIELAPGVSRTVSFRLGREELALLDHRMEPVVEPGTFTVFVGGSSAVTREARFTVEEP
jgi:beta-glucosidase